MMVRFGQYAYSALMMMGLADTVPVKLLSRSVSRGYRPQSV